jgi:ABC-2 type transport system permease protein
VELARPYTAAFASRFLLTLQYRAAAFAGFMTQCWWGAIKVMVYAAFYASSPVAASAPISLSQVITYTWLAQAFLALTPWSCDPDIALATRTGSVGYDRLRPVDTYWLWYSRAGGWITSRAVPRAGLMFLLAGVSLPLIGLREWSWAPPPSVAQASLFVVSMLLVVALSSAMMMLLNVAAVAILNDRGVNSLFGPIVIVLSGNLIPLALFPDWMHVALFVQPFAGLIDIPFRIYSGNLAGGVAWTGIGHQAFWTVVTVAAGHAWMARVMNRLSMQGS